MDGSGREMTGRDRLRRLARLALLAAAAAGLAFGLLGLGLTRVPPPEPVVVVRPAVRRDLPGIREGGVLRVALWPDSVDYARRRGRDEGFSLELARLAARRLGVGLEVVVPANPSRALRDLDAGRVDLVAIAAPAPRPVATEVAWLRPVELSPPVVLGRGAARVVSLENLAGREVAVVRHTALEAVAERWRKLLGGRLAIRRLPPDTPIDRLARDAALGRVGLVVLDERRARLEAGVFPPLGVSTPLGEPLPWRWAVRPGTPRLAAALDRLLADARGEGLVARLEARYLDDPVRLRRWRRPVFRAGGSRLSPWDGIFRRAAAGSGFDWRLLAALAFAESGYDPFEVSSRGAIGLLQLMPATARAFGADDPFDPAQNVAAGARHLRWLCNLFRDVPPGERIPFALAAYNMGLAHVEDARELARRRGLDPNRWEGGVAAVLPLLEDPAIAATLPHGRARGRVTLRYVEHVLRLYRRFRGGEPLPAGEQATARRAVEG